MTALIQWLRSLYNLLTGRPDDLAEYPNRVRQLDRGRLRCWALSPTKMVWLEPGKRPRVAK